MRNEAMAYIEFRNIIKNFGTVNVLKGISLDIEEGEFVTLLGPSGCGKSTLLRCFSGLEPVSDGEFYVQGRNITKLTPKQREIGMVFQQYSLFPNMTVMENVAFGLKMKKVPKIQRDQKVHDMLKIVGLDDKATSYPKELSGGQQQRVALARALVVEPKVLLLDEPLSAIDALLRRNLQIEIRRIQKELNITSVFVTHDQDEAMVMSDRIFLMNAGKIEQSGKPEELYAAPKTAFVANFMGHYNLMRSEEFNRLAGTSYSSSKIAVRPEAIHVLLSNNCSYNSDNEKITTEGKVVSEVTRGNIRTYTIAHNGSKMHFDVLFDPREHYQVNETIRIQIAKKDILELA